MGEVREVGDGVRMGMRMRVRRMRWVAVGDVVWPVQLSVRAELPAEGRRGRQGGVRGRRRQLEAAGAAVQRAPRRYAHNRHASESVFSFAPANLRLRNSAGTPWGLASQRLIAPRNRPLRNTHRRTDR